MAVLRWGSLALRLRRWSVYLSDTSQDLQDIGETRQHGLYKDLCLSSCQLAQALMCAPWPSEYLRWNDARCTSRKPRATRETGRYKARGGFWGSASVPGREDPRGMFALSKHWCTLWGTREMAPEGLVASVIVPDRTEAVQVKAYSVSSIPSKKATMLWNKTPQWKLGLFADIFFAKRSILIFFFL